eukprot:5684994-Pyramimonas_sp.AAC.2
MAGPAVMAVKVPTEKAHMSTHQSSSTTATTLATICHNCRQTDRPHGRGRRGSVRCGNVPAGSVTISGTSVANTTTSGVQGALSSNAGVAWSGEDA